MSSELKLKDKTKLVFWILRKIHETSPHNLPLRLIASLVKLFTIYFPIVSFSLILRQAISQNWTQLFGVASLVFVVSFATELLLTLLTSKLKIMTVQMSGRLMAELRLHSMSLDYQTATSSEQKEKFRQALKNMTFEMGDFYSFISRISEIFEHLLSILTSLAFSSYLIFSQPQPGLGQGLTAWVAQPLPALVLCLLSLALGLVFQIVISRQGMAKQRLFHQKHAEVESALNYYVFEVTSAINKLAYFQTYDMLGMIKNNFNQMSAKAFDFFKLSFGASKQISLATSISSTMFMVSGYGIAGVKALTGAIELASVITYARAFIQMNVGLIGIVHKLNLLNNSLVYYQDIKSYMELKNKLDTGSIPVEKRADHLVELEFENVSFHYPNSDKYVLKDINLKLDMNKKHALVGPNGSGKTTLILLLCRLYDPSKGRILLNGIDIRKYDYWEYLSIISVVFQDYMLFALPLAENVAARKDYDQDLLVRSLDKLSFLKDKSKSLDILNRPVIDIRSGQAKFSGGEQQKIAIARALYKDASLVILDEPTASLDPKSESEIYEHLQNLIEDKTSIFISHRMSSCRLCEDIIVLNDGQLIERGSHQDLLKFESLYKEMWEAQAQYYR